MEKGIFQRLRVAGDDCVETRSESQRGSVPTIGSNSQQVIAVTETLHHLFEPSPVSRLQIQLRRTGKALAKCFRFAFEVATQGILLGLYVIPRRSYRHQRDADN